MLSVVLNAVLSKAKGDKKHQACKMPKARPRCLLKWTKAICYRLKKKVYNIILYKSKIYNSQIKIRSLENKNKI